MLAIVALFAAIFGYFLANGVRQTEDRLVVRSSAASQVVATNAYWISEVAHQTLLRVDAALGLSMKGTDEGLHPALEGVPLRTEVYVVDEEARTVFSTVPGAAKVSVADREYFTAVRDGTQFYTSPLIVSRLTDDRIFVFSKRLERQGQFAGAIMVSFPEDLLQDMFEDLDLEDGSTVSLIRADGQLIGRYPPAEGPMDLSGLPLFTDYLSSAPAGTYTSARSPVDGIARTVGYRTVPDTNIIALASISTDQTWRDFNQAVITVLIIASPIIMGLLLGCLWIVRLLRRDAVQADELRQLVDANTLLLREVHHRVKNNLQSVQGLVRLHNIPEGTKADLLGRLGAMASMHEHIYRHDQYRAIETAEYVPVIVDEVIRAYGRDAKVTYEVENLTIGIDNATPIALLLNELVTNSLKHGIPDATEIGIQLVAAGKDRAVLTVRDNGPGLPDDQGKPSRSMGMRLVQGVVRQLNGTFSFRNDNGAVFEAEIELESSQI